MILFVHLAIKGIALSKCAKSFGQAFSKACEVEGE